MRLNVPRDNDHVADLLPAYINQTLDPVDNARVHSHLLTCALCRDELALWQGIAELTTRFALATEPATVPSLALLDRIWTEVEAPAAQKSSVLHALSRKLVLMWQLARVQVLLLPRGSWIALPLGIVLGFLLLSVSDGGRYLPTMLGFVAPLVTAAAVGFIYSRENDPGLEVTLATPTSPRLVLLSRLVLVLGYNFSLALVVTLFIALLQGGNLALVVSLWMGPMLLLTGFSLLLSLTVSTMSGVGSAISLWCIHFIPYLFPLEGNPFQAAIMHFNAFWQTNPTTIVCAAILFILAVYRVPRQVARVA
ncbi:MAG TPA: zf-HC2 domain-containing protein [Ktedonobacteraceae bacterium]|nr:zf-HC2 domain-containing protein [Ktedonobacteraceae bacterium]